MYRNHVFKILLCCLLIPVVLAVAVYMAVLNTQDSKIELSLNGDRMITLEYGESYVDAGATAVVVDRKTGERTETEVTVSGEVDTGKIGVYTICYTASCENRIGTIYRRVEVADTQAPVIALVSDPARYTLPGNTYEEEGFSATDNYDGDLTELVQRTQTKDAVIYTVRDSSGNLTRITRKIVYNDPVAPELKLAGDSMVVISVGDDYKEPGYTASDNCDGDVTARVQVSGSVNTFRSGKYTLTYTVSDTYQNTVKATRTVFVKEREVSKVNDPAGGEKFIYLTFDDGPGANTPRLLDILKKYNVPATFFVVNTRYISTIKRASEEGHTIAIHTATHKFKEIYASEDAYFKDLYKMQDLIKQYTGKTATLMRFPGGASNTISSFNKGIMTRLTKLVEEKGFTYFDWNVDSKDAGGAKTAKQVYNNVVSGIGSKTNSVVLMHDIKTYTIDAIEQIIVWGLANGYTFRALTADSPTCHHRVNN